MKCSCYSSHPYQTRKLMHGVPTGSTGEASCLIFRATHFTTLFWFLLNANQSLLHFYSHFLSLWLCSPFDLGRCFSFLSLLTIGTTPWTGNRPVARPLPTNRATQTQNKRTQISVPRVGFKPTNPVFMREKTVHALDKAATEIGLLLSWCPLLTSHVNMLCNNVIASAGTVEPVMLSWSGIPRLLWPVLPHSC
jgi:hypothetical protein